MHNILVKNKLPKKNKSKLIALLLIIFLVHSSTFLYMTYGTTKEQTELVGWNWNLQVLNNYDYPSFWHSNNTANTTLPNLLKMGHSKIQILDTMVVDQNDETFSVYLFAYENSLTLGIKSSKSENWIIKQILTLSLIKNEFGKNISEIKIILPKLVYNQEMNLIYSICTLQNSTNYCIFGVTADLNGKVNSINSLIDGIGTIDSMDAVYTGDTLLLSWNVLTDFNNLKVNVATFKLNVDQNLLKERSLILDNRELTNETQTSIAIATVKTEENIFSVFYTNIDGLFAKNIALKNKEILLQSSYNFTLATNSSIPYNVKVNQFSGEELIVLTWIELNPTFDSVNNVTVIHENLYKGTWSLGATIPKSDEDWNSDAFQYYEPVSTEITEQVNADDLVPHSFIGPVTVTIDKSYGTSFIYSYLQIEDQKKLPNIKMGQYVDPGLRISSTLVATASESIAEFLPTRSIWFENTIHTDNQHYIFWLRDLGLDRIGIVFGKGESYNLQKPDSSDLESLLFLTITLTPIVALVGIILYLKRNELKK